MPSLWSPTNWPAAPGRAASAAPASSKKRLCAATSARSACCSARFCASRPATHSSRPSKPFAAPPSPAAKPKEHRTRHDNAASHRRNTRHHPCRAALDLATAYQLARAFGFYFELINLAETNHRKRRRLCQTAAGPRSTPRPARRPARHPAPPARGRRLRRRGPRAARAHLHLPGLHRAPH